MFKTMSACNLLMVAAENDGIAGCKVGGIGDVLRDLPAALSAHSCRVSVLTPSYGFLHRSAGAIPTATVRFWFAGAPDQATLYRVSPRSPETARSIHFVLDHPAFAGGEPGALYCDDPADRPFATDAARFARFCAATAAAVRDGLFGPLDLLHLHDWHAAFLLLLRHYDPAYASLRALRTVFTIHNLALQGVRPLRGDVSSLERWFPHLPCGDDAPADLRDPRWPDCFNPMALGIRLADAVHAVSPTYAQEILRPGNPPHFSGGEGLETDLQRAHNEGRLHGILNGCEYPAAAPLRLPPSDLFKELKTAWIRQAARRTSLSFADFLALQQLEKRSATRKQPALIVTGVSRITSQKTLLLKAAGSDGSSGLEKILRAIGPHGLYILLGTGDRTDEALLTEAAALHPNFLFLNGYSPVAERLYASGDLFLMPSSFEPCGISQMLALRAGQPCLVHRTGGLRDTILPGVTGFGFEGKTLAAQVDAMESALRQAVDLHKNQPEAWETLRRNATTARFLWSDSARQCLDLLYQPAGARHPSAPDPQPV
jgi:starch synthase